MTIRLRAAKLKWALAVILTLLFVCCFVSFMSCL